MKKTTDIVRVQIWTNGILSADEMMSRLLDTYSCSVSVDPKDKGQLIMPRVLYKHLNENDWQYYHQLLAI